VLKLGDVSAQQRGDRQDEVARLVLRAATLDGLIELHLGANGLSEPSRHLLRERFGEGLMLTE
jgi:hypothetical protein